MAIGDAPVLEALADINAVSIARTELDERTLLMVRLAALASVDAPAASYLMHIGPAAESGTHDRRRAGRPRGGGSDRGRAADPVRSREDHRRARARGSDPRDGRRPGR